MEKIIIFDTTLRDGEQSPGASMNQAEKVRIATQLEAMGVDVIEAGFPAASVGDFEAVREIARVVKESEVAGLSRASKSDIDRTWEAIQFAAKPRIHTFIATSEIHLKYKLGMTEEQALARAVEAVAHAKTLTDEVEFSAEDGSRTDKDFLCRIFEAVIEAGATTLNLPDTVGYAIPEEFGKLLEYVIANTPNIDQAVLSVHCHNDLGRATSNTLAAIKSGARQVEVTVNGIGERAGNTSLEEVVMNFHTRPDLYPYDTNIVTEMIYPTSRLVSMISGIMVQPNRPIVGANAFAHESGIHQDGMLKNSMTYEIMKPETIGLNGNNLVLGKLSGRNALFSRLKELGYDITDEERDVVFHKFKKLADKKRAVEDADLDAIVAECLFRTPEVFALEYIHVSSGTSVKPQASVQISVNGEIIDGANFGNGPIDALFKAIVPLTNPRAKLLRFTIGALTGGTDAQGEVTVRLQENGFVALGRGADSDIITASALALVNGLNRLEYLKKNPQPKGTEPQNVKSVEESFSRKKIKA